MLPAKQNKIDLSKLSEEELKAFRMYGKLPSNKNVLVPKFKERKYFDSGDYAMQKAGKSTLPVGIEHPSPESIPHSSPTNAANALSTPAKESISVVKSGESKIANIASALPPSSKN
ncbi:hypothetical protein DSO57_1007198 [Entomophthora muscae]|uniref:Uncharacterized protein n=2 Tax=Entomophthora muscae TaxID=34485 RepID=A0ACC2TI04_9FUNG|nr:hypothetical protein DSO57_1021082 [Entomophthora muscae]KAJ9074349.1 hypothetical protein DSO57_1007198 [Entomophthora muscae]